MDHFCIMMCAVKRDPSLIPNHTNHFYTIFFSLYFCIENPVPMPYSSPLPSISRLADWYMHIYFHVIRLIFPSTERLAIETRNWSRFFNLAKKMKIGSRFWKILEMFSWWRFLWRFVQRKILRESQTTMSGVDDHPLSSQERILKD